jgi:hypothetical protein
VAEGARLESVYTGNRIVGSNPTPSASKRAAEWRDDVHHLSSAHELKRAQSSAACLARVMAKMRLTKS